MLIDLIQVVLFSLTLANALVHNCPTSVKQEIASRLFMDQIDRIIRNGHVTVRNRALELVQSWADLAASDSTFDYVAQFYNQLKRQGFGFSQTRPASPTVLCSNKAC
jgi:signal transducing adaptor molecule